MATKKTTTKSQTFKSFEELDPNKIRIMGNVRIVDDNEIIDINNQQETTDMAKKKEEPAQQVETKPNAEEVKPDAKEDKPAETPKAETTKEPKKEETKSKEGEEKMNKDVNETKVETKATETTTANAAPAAPAVPDLEAAMGDLHKLASCVKDGKIEHVYKREETPLWKDCARAAAIGACYAAAVIGVAIGISALCGGDSAE